MRHRSELCEIFRAALDAVHGGRAVERALRGESPRPPVFVLGAGKAACAMASGVCDVLGERVREGLVVGADGALESVPGIEVRAAGHPLPDARGVAAAEAALAFARRTPSDATLLVLISGGASALWPAPVSGVTLDAKRSLTDLLLRSGVPIRDLNAVRKHLSRIKGGGLARVCGAGRVLTLLVSDVSGDAVDAIGSGPTAPDPTRYADAERVLRDAVGLDAVPRAVREHISAGVAGRVPETPKPGNRCFDAVEHRVVATLADALAAAASAGSARGLAVHALGEALRGEARELAPGLGAQARELRSAPPALLVAGGEPVVHVRGAGRGGRAQELALAFALEIDGEEGLSALFAGTDGSDGPTDAAGAVVDGTTAARARALGLEPRDHLDRNDAYPLLRATGDLLLTGPTHTNVTDLALIRAGAGSMG